MLDSFEYLLSARVAAFAVDPGFMTLAGGAHAAEVHELRIVGVEDFDQLVVREQACLVKVMLPQNGFFVDLGCRFGAPINEPMMPIHRAADLSIIAALSPTLEFR